MATKTAIYDVVEFKSLEADGGQPGEFSAIVSVFGNVDLQGDRVMPDAFDGSLERWQKSGDPIPVIWSHDWQNPAAHIGYIDPKNAVSTDRGLLVHGKNDVDTNPFAAQAHKLLVERRVKQWSFAYNVIGEKRAKDGANDLTELDLIEVGPTLKGANPDTLTLAAKADLEDALAKAGARLSAASKAEMQAIHDHLSQGLDRMRAFMGTATEEPKAVEPEAAPGEQNETVASDDDREPSTAKSFARLLTARTSIEEMGATLGPANGTNSP